ncbi:Major facilitator superfamily domain, general substrate transporter [Lasallia pustulata]|uniref:Major facilitator superfamily domain, general substrate transporter n=1 Tax=Lasallia pustulata TaxID=136370 RepID=A0A1W5D7H2_9LECA|nr:Major facilitator superfamily domain, general substrate transporter [Lasallia pustulata]
MSLTKECERPPRTDSVCLDETQINRLETWPRNWRAYRALLGGFLLMFNSWGLVNTYGTFQSYYLSHLMPTTDPALISLIGGTQSFFILFGSFITGRLLDSGHHRHLGATGGILSTLGMFMLSITSGQGSRGDGKYWAIWLTQGLTVGLGMSCMFVYSSQVVASWFIRRRGLAIGITASGASISGLIYPIMFKFLVARGSFPIAVRYLAILVGCTSFIAFLCAIPNPALILRIPDKWLAYEVWFDKSAFHRPPYPWFVAAMCFVFLGFYPIFFNLEDWAQWKGIGIKEDIANGTGGLHGESGFRTFYFLSIMNACSTVGRVLGAYLSDHYGALNIHLAATSLACIFIFIFWPLATALSHALAFVVLFGIVSGTVIGLPPACVASLLAESEQQRLGQWTAGQNV